MPFGKSNKSSKQHHRQQQQQQQHQQIQHERVDQQHQDEFLHYFRQHRHPDAVPPSDMSYSLNNFYSDRMMSPDSEYEFGSCYSSLARFPANSRPASSSCGLFPSPPPLPPPQRRHPMSSASSAATATSSLSPTSGLGELSGMLAEKMSFSGYRDRGMGGGSMDPVPRHLIANDDVQSRDSGHLTGSSAATNSSSESPRFRPLNGGGGGVLSRFRDSYGHMMRRRAMPPPKQLSLDSGERLCGGGGRRNFDWDLRHGLYSNEVDHNSVYSYNTALDERDSGVSGGTGSVASYMDYNPNFRRAASVARRQQDYHGGPGVVGHVGDGGRYFDDNVSLQSGHLGTLFSDLDDQEDDLSVAANSWSPWMSTAGSTTTANALRHRQPEKNGSPAQLDYSRMSYESDPGSRSPLKEQTLSEQKSKPAEATSGRSLNRLLSVLWLMVKLCLSVGCCTLLCLALFVASRSVTCRWSGHQKMDLSTLEAVLKTNVIGQPLAIREIVEALGQFYNKSFENGNNSVLVLYLLGWLGTGKTLTSSHLKSQFPLPSNVHMFSVPVHFASGLGNSRNNLMVLDDLAEHIKRSCGYSMVIFDDLDPENLSPAVSSHLSKFIVSLNERRTTGSSSSSESVSNGTIVVITTSAGGQAINKKLFDLPSGQVDGSALLSQRDGVTLDDIVDALRVTESRIPLLETIAETSVMLRLVPFLPLTRDHVRQCIMRELSTSGGATSGVNAAEVNAILDDLSFFSDSFPVFSKTGCKKVSSKVDLLLGNRHSFLGLG